ncbi:hypothetical protein KPH14_009390 [Odynerus spinipes]|uniref:Unconventional prefoldin RPB5 interactor n=1 Tax=Odynerus spinipes TaxID=1348599 RepID=A0AAD9RQC2_9HYME|nr:hypothetical protein KPH14_009390 [Odynerus spinipes]
MSGAMMDTSNVNLESMKEYRHMLLNQVLSEGIRRNEEQCKIWTEYKKRHNKVIEALEKLPLELKINCMVPVGKRALMKGKLIHTNEVLACLGEGYFAKYSAAQAIALCKRRIQSADEMLKNLETERNLYEMRQVVPLEFGAFGEEERADLVEHWDEKKLNDWRAEHRQREKEYHKKLSELKKKKKTEIKTEDDLFQRLDELELQEELADEMNRLEDECKEFYGEELEQGEVYYETDEEESSEDDYTMEEIEKEFQKLKEIRMAKNKENQSIEPKITENIVNTEKEISSTNSEPIPEKIDKILPKTVSEVSCSNVAEIPVNESSKIAKSKSMSDINNEETKVKKQRRVSLIVPNSSTDHNDNAEVSGKSQKEQCTKTKSADVGDTEDDGDVIRIEFKHSDNNPCIPEFTGNRIESPSDIYRKFYKPKSILKRSPNDVMPPRDISVISTNTSEDEEDEDEDEAIKPSAYNFVVKDICEKQTSIKKNTVVAQDKRPVSRFKMERFILKK